MVKTQCVTFGVYLPSQRISTQDTYELQSNNTKGEKLLPVEESGPFHQMIHTDMPLIHALARTQCPLHVPAAQVHSQNEDHMQMKGFLQNSSPVL